MFHDHDLGESRFRSVYLVLLQVVWVFVGDGEGVAGCARARPTLLLTLAGRAPALHAYPAPADRAGSTRY